MNLTPARLRFHVIEARLRKAFEAAADPAVLERTIAWEARLRTGKRGQS